MTISSCHPLPKTPHAQKSLILTQKVAQLHASHPTDFTVKTRHLSDAISEQTQNHPRLSGYYPIATGVEAFASRSILSGMAQQTIDVQYYIWHNDEAGQLMLKELWQAAERGVLVRLLLDDINLNPQLDALLASFATHPNIAVRLVNPATYRQWRWLSFATSPWRMNKRMHNKSITFDNTLSIIGGRNIGNEYLNKDQNSNFADLDVLLIGDVVPSITQSFENYWQSALSYDIQTLVSPQHKHFLQLIDKTNPKKSQNQTALSSYQQAVNTATIGQELLNKQLAFRWAKIDFVADNADKLMGIQHNTLVNQLKNIFGKPNTYLSIVSSYFVPTQDGVQGLSKLAHQGVTVQILTNSYDATDVGAVHSGYANHRKALLKAGVRLFELKSTAKTQKDDNKLWRTKGQTTTSLHAKAFAVDSHKVFIGSYNFDPRSANINTEMGVVIYDNQLATRIHQAFDDRLLHQAYELKLQGGQLQWYTIDNGKPLLLNKEPNTANSHRLGVYVLSKLPIDWLL